MTFIEVYIRQIESLWSGATLYFPQPSGPANPFIVALIVPPNNETPLVLCEDQGEGGAIEIQFSCAADSGIEAMSELEDLKTIVRGIRGVIGTAPNSYRISENRCTGVQSFDASLGTWSAIFEDSVQWDKVT